MKTIGILALILSAITCPSDCSASSLEELQSSAGINFEEIETGCYEISNLQKHCFRSRKCTVRNFQKLDRSYYYLLQSSFVQYINTPKDEEKEYCSGEPSGMRASLYKMSVGKMSQIGEINQGGCNLWVERILSYTGVDILKTSCSFTGTAGIFEETYYIVTENKLKKISFDPEKINLPHASLGYDSFTIQRDEIEFHSRAHSKYCQCVASFSASLEIKNMDGDTPYFVYKLGSYRPLFTSKSNAENRKGLKAYGKKDYKKASVAFLKAAKLDVSNYEAFSNLGLAYLKLGELKKARKELEYVYQHASESQKANAAYNIGMVYEEEKDYERAERFYIESNTIRSTKTREVAIKRIKDRAQE